MALKIDGILIDHKKIRKAFYDHKSKTFEVTMADFMIVSEQRFSEEQKKNAITGLCREIVTSNFVPSVFRKSNSPLN